MPDIDFAKMLVPAVNVAEIVLRTFVVYLIVTIGLRLVGKRELGQMTALDLVLIITLSNAVQNAMTGPDSSLPGGIVSALTLLGSNWLFNTLILEIPIVKKWLVGDPTLLMHNGKMIRDRMEREGIDEDELLMAARQRGIDDLKDVEDAVLEVDGSISIVQKESEGAGHRVRRRRFRKRQ